MSAKRRSKGTPRHLAGPPASSTGNPWRFKSSHPLSPSRRSRATFFRGLFMSRNGHASTEPRGPKAGHKACFTLGDRGASLGSLGSVHQKVERPRRDLPAGGEREDRWRLLSARPRLRPGRHPSTVTPSIDRCDRRVRGRAERAAKCGQSGSRPFAPLAVEVKYPSPGHSGWLFDLSLEASRTVRSLEPSYPARGLTLAGFRSCLCPEFLLPRHPRPEALFELPVAGPPRPVVGRIRRGGEKRMMGLEPTTFCMARALAASPRFVSPPSCRTQSCV